MFELSAWFLYRVSTGREILQIKCDELRVTSYFRWVAKEQLKYARVLDLDDTKLDEVASSLFLSHCPYRLIPCQRSQG